MLRPDLDGLRFKFKDGDKPGEAIYLVDRGKFRRIATRGVYDNLFRDRDWIWVTDLLRRAEIEFGAPILRSEPLAKWGPDLYFLEKEFEKGYRKVANPLTLDRYQFKLERLDEMTRDPQKHPDLMLGPPIVWSPRFNGNRVKAAGSPQIYLIDRGKRCHIDDYKTYGRLFGNEAPCEVPSLDDIPLGPVITRWAALIATPGDPKLYFSDGISKRHIVDTNTRLYYGFSAGEIQLLDSAWLAHFPERDPIQWPGKTAE
jgi:hypothetical protein